MTKIVIFTLKTIKPISDVPFTSTDYTPVRWEVPDEQTEWLNPQKWVHWYNDMSDIAEGYSFEVLLDTFHVHDEVNKTCQTFSSV